MAKTHRDKVIKMTAQQSIKIDNTALNNKAPSNVKKSYRPATPISMHDKEVITNTIFPVVVELKCQFLKALPPNVSLRDRRKMMRSLNIAGDVVLNMDALMFDCTE